MRIPRILVRPKGELPRLDVPLDLTRFVFHGLRKFLGCDSLVGKGPGHQVAQVHVGATFVVVAPPVLDAFGGNRHNPQK